MPRTSRLARLGIAVWFLGLILNGCGEGGAIIGPPPPGAVQVTTVTNGVEPDADGYSVQMDAEPATAIGSAETHTFTGVTPGDHALRLEGLAANCTVSGDNPRSVTVTASDTTSVTFEVTCSSTAVTGSIQVTTATSGNSADADGYTVSLDNGSPQAIKDDTPITIESVAAGDHRLELAGMASNCTVEGENPRTVQVTAGTQAATTFTVSCSASVGSIAFASLLQPGVFLVNTDGTGLIKLADGEHPIWSPDGEQLLFRGGGGLAVMNADGTSQRTLTTIPRGSARVFEWSPDGTMIVFCTETNSVNDPHGLDNELWLIRADGTGLIRLSSSAYTASWSPDSRQIVFADQGSLHVINPDGTGLTTLAPNTLAREPEWSPDGTQIAFSGNLNVYTVHPDGSGLTNLTNSEAVATEPKWSPDGGSIAFMTKESSTEFDIAVMNRDGSGFHLVTNSPDADYEPEWSPDGGQILFTRAGDGREIFVVNADGSDETQVTYNTPSWAGEPDWRPRH